MKYIVIILVLLFFSQTLLSQDKQFQLEDLILKEVYVEKRKSSYYLLHLQDSLKKITVKALIKPTKIVASYLDDKYFVIIYWSSRYGHFLTGAYKDPITNIWHQDYFHKALDN